MLEDFDEAGNLPRGIHDATIAEISLRFGGNPRRAKVLADLLNWLRHMKFAGCRTVYIDGSFVTSASLPNDFDACYDPTGIDKAKLDPVLLDRSDDGKERVKAKYGGDIRLDREFPPGTIWGYRQFFMFDHRTGREKGIVRLDLSENF